MKDVTEFTTRKFDLTPGQTEFKNSERSLYIKYGPKACGIVQCPREWLGEVFWVIKLWVYPDNVDGFDSGQERQIQVSIKFGSSTQAIKWLKKNTTKLITAHNIWLAPINQMEIKYGFIK